MLVIVVVGGVTVRVVHFRGMGSFFEFVAGVVLSLVRLLRVICACTPARTTYRIIYLSLHIRVWFCGMRRL